MFAPKTKQAVVAEFRCAEILRAARKVFAREGFDAATVDEIAKAADLAKGTVYVYFHSKRDLYLAAVKQSMAALLEETRRNMDRAPTLAGKIQAYLSSRVKFAEDNRDSMALYYTESGCIAPGCFRREFKNLYLQQARPLEEALAEASRDGKIRGLQPDTAAFCINEMTQALIRRRLLGWSKASAEEEIQTLFDLIWHGLEVACKC